MRFNININNVKAKEWNLTVQQAYLFVFFYELPSWAKPLTIENKTYYFASKNKAIEEMPLLTEKRDTMYRYYKQIEEKGLIEIVKTNGQDYVRLTQKGKEWNCQSEQSEKNPSKVGKKSELGSENYPTYNNTINNNTSIIKEKTKIDKYQFLELWNKSRVHFKVVKESNANMFPYQSINDLKELTEIYSKEDFKTALKGLMKQQGGISKGLKSNIKHFLQPDHFERYLDAYNNKNFTLYDSEEKQGTKISL